MRNTTMQLWCSPRLAAWCCATPRRTCASSAVDPVEHAVSLAVTAARLTAVCARVLGQLLEEVPHDDGGCVGDVERVFGAALRNLDAAVAGVDGLLRHAAHLVAQNDGQPLSWLDGELLQAHTAMHLLDRADAVAGGAQLGDGIQHCGVVRPRHGVLGTQGGLVNLGLGRNGGDAAQADALDQEGIGCAKHATHVHLAAHVVEHHGDGQLCKVAILLGIDTMQLEHGFLLH